MIMKLIMLLQQEWKENEKGNVYPWDYVVHALKSDKSSH